VFAALPATHLSATGGLTWLQLIGFMLPALFLIMGDQNIYQRFSAAKDGSVARKSALGFLGAMLIVGPLLLFGALASRAMWPGIEGDTALMVLAVETLPGVLGGLVLAGLMAFIVTTGDSYLLSCASSFTYDLYVRARKTAASPQKLIWVNRAAVVVIGALAYVLVSYFPSVLQIQMFSYAMYGAAITPSILAAFLWKRATAAACVSSMAVGALATLVWELFLQRPGDLNSIVFALPLSLLALIAVSLLTRPASGPKLDAFFSS
jgi:solute:Na+ symporter, SSS family